MESAYDDELPPPPSQASSHFPLEPISGSTLFDAEVARREQLHRLGTLTTGCAEIDGQVLGGHGFERGSVVGISAEHMDTGLLIGLQTIAHSLLANPGPEPHGQAQQPPLRAAVITTLAARTILPHLRDVVKVQARLKLGGARCRPDEVDVATKLCLGRIAVSQVFDIEGLWEVLNEIETAAEAVEDERAAEPAVSKEEDGEGCEDQRRSERDTQPVPGPHMDLPASSQQLPPPSSPSPSLPPSRPPPPPATKLPPLRMRTEVQDSEEEDDVLLSSSPLSSLPSLLVETPEGMDELAAQPSPPAAPSFHQPSPPLSPAAPSHQPSPTPPAAPGRQSSPLPIPPPRQSEPTAPGLPDIILITHTSDLFRTLFTARDKTSSHTTLQLLSSHLRYLSRSAGPLILLLNDTSASPTALSNTTNPGQPPPPRRPETEQSTRPLDPSLRSIFNPPHPSHLGYVSTTAHALSRKNKPAFGHTFAQFLDLHLLCTKIPRSQEDADVLFHSTISVGRQQQQQRPIHYAWVIEALADELGVWEWEDAGGAAKGQNSKAIDTTDKKWKIIDREQRWGAVEVRSAGCQVVDVYDTTRGNAIRPNTEPIRLAAGFGGRRV